MDNLNFYRDRYLEYCTFNRNLAPGTIYSYRYDLNNFIFFLEKLEPPVLCWTQVKRRHLDHYLEVVSEHYSVCTIKGNFSSLRCFFYFLQEDGLEFDSPFRRFRLHMQKPASIPISLTLGEVTGILEEAYRSENPNAFQKARDILVLELLFSGGMRVGELCGITLSRYDPVEKTIEVIGKGSKNRILFITNKEVLSLLDDYLALRSHLSFRNGDRLLSDNLLITDGLLPLKPIHVRGIIKKYVMASGITKRVTPHTFRHTFASLLLEEGVDIKYIQEFLGHSSIKTTQIYLHTSSGRKREILAEMHPRKRLGPK